MTDHFPWMQSIGREIFDFGHIKHFQFTIPVEHPKNDTFLGDC